MKSHICSLSETKKTETDIIHKDSVDCEIVMMNELAKSHPILIQSEELDTPELKVNQSIEVQWKIVDVMTNLVSETTSESKQQDFSVLDQTPTRNDMPSNMFDSLNDEFMNEENRVHELDEFAVKKEEVAIESILKPSTLLNEVHKKEPTKVTWKKIVHYMNEEKSKKLIPFN